MSLDLASTPHLGAEHVSFYRFTTFSDLPALKSSLLCCASSALRGTVLIAEEGINACISGPAADLELFVKQVQEIPGCAALELKKTVATGEPYRRFCVKIKKEIIAMGTPGLDVAKEAAPYVEPDQLLTWLAAGERITFLDTRNRYEIDVGTFRDAVNPGIDTFRQFPAWLAKQSALPKEGSKVVTFCTGGIRCEKASALMTRAGYKDVYQLHGGILRYLAETRGKAQDNAYEGSCFVFDYRVALDRELNAGALSLCYNCWNPLSPADLESAAYVAGKQCARCVERNARRAEKAVRNYTAAMERRFERSRATRARFARALPAP